MLKVEVGIYLLLYVGMSTYTTHGWYVKEVLLTLSCLYILPKKNVVILLKFGNIAGICKNYLGLFYLYIMVSEICYAK